MIEWFPFIWKLQIWHGHVKQDIAASQYLCFRVLGVRGIGEILSKVVRNYSIFMIGKKVSLGKNNSFEFEKYSFKKNDRKFIRMGFEIRGLFKRN